MTNDICTVRKSHSPRQSASRHQWAEWRLLAFTTRYALLELSAGQCPGSATLVALAETLGEGRSTQARTRDLVPQQLNRTNGRLGRHDENAWQYTSEGRRMPCVSGICRGYDGFHGRQWKCFCLYLRTAVLKSVTNKVRSSQTPRRARMQVNWTKFGG